MSTVPSYIDSVKITFEYDVPDKFCHQTNDLGKKGTFTYEGPEKFYCFVDNKTKLVQVGMDAEAYDEDKADEQLEWVNLKAGSDLTAVLVEAEKEPLLATLIWMDHDFEENYPCKTWKLEGDDTVHYWKSEPLIPNEAYAQDEIQYDFDKKEWVKPFPWEKPSMSEEQFEETRKSILWHVEQEFEKDPIYKDPAKIELREKMIAHMDDLRNLRTKFPMPEWDPWMVPFPKNPRGDIHSGNPEEADESNDPDRSKVGE